jgi:putative ABC transport system permease protein
MKIFNLILKEIRHRKFNFLLSLLAVVVAVGLFLFFFTTSEASIRETKRIMRDIGFNLRVIPKETDMEEFWAKGYSEHTMPEEYIYRFASQKDIAYNHLTATLHKKVPWRGMEVILTGISPEEVVPPGKPKSPMSFSIEEGNVYIGFEIAHKLGLKESDTVDILGESFIVKKRLPESGSVDDIRIYGNLHDMQRILNSEGQINEIKALECLCLIEKDGWKEDPLAVVREQLKNVLPEAKVVLIKSIAEAREKQRRMIEKYLELIIPFVLVASGAWIGVLSLMNVRERRTEIGIMRALGYGSFKIGMLFLGKAVLIGLIGAFLGFVVGEGIALLYGPEIFKVTARMIKPAYGLLGWSLIAAPAFAALSSFIPAVIAVTEDPALILREE